MPCCAVIRPEARWNACAKGHIAHWLVVGQIWFGFSHGWTYFGQTWPTSFKFGPILANFGPMSAQNADMPAKFAPNPAPDLGLGFGETWPDAGQVRSLLTKAAPIPTKVGRCQPTPGKFGKSSRSGRILPSLVELGPDSAKLGSSYSMQGVAFLQKAFEARHRLGATCRVRRDGDGTWGLKAHGPRLGSDVS